MPREAPIDNNVDFDCLADHEMTGGNVQSVVFRAASRAALRDKVKRIITHADLESAVNEELNKISGRNSDANRMYN